VKERRIVLRESERSTPRVKETTVQSEVAKERGSDINMIAAAASSSNSSSMP